MSGHMQPTQLHRRTSRGSASQGGCRSSRIEKTKSHHNSPKAMERRKTTSETKLYATLDDHYRMMFGVDPEEEERPQSTRPVSWHPASSQPQPSQQQQQTNYFEPMPQQHWSQNYSPSRDSCHGSDYYSLSARNSMLDTRTSAFSSSEYGWQSTAQQTPGYVNSCMNTPTSEPLPWYLQQWAQKNQAQVYDSQDSAPAQQQDAQQDQDMDDDEEEGEKLVALGLYDTPEPSLTWGALTEGTGKGLKLEETWQPPEEEDEDDDDDASSEASVEEPSPPLPAVHEPVQHMPVHVKSQTPNSMEGQSFFFDDDETVSKEWWFQQVKQPSMPVRDAGLGYGWL